MKKYLLAVMFMTALCLVSVAARAGFDSDGDGVSDSSDNCPTVSNPNQQDQDADGVGDACDACPGTPLGTGVDPQTGCPLINQMDSDGDGVFDVFDQCPGTPPGMTVDVHGCPTAPNSVCGDNVKSATETCDGLDLGGQTCASLGLASGVLTCSQDCSYFDASSCGSASTPSCGDGHIDAFETCDGPDLGGQTCASLGFSSGTLTCNSNCKLNANGCVKAPVQKSRIWHLPVTKQPLFDFSKGVTKSLPQKNLSK